MTEEDDDHPRLSLPQEFIDGVAKEMVMHLVAEAGGYVEISVDDMQKSCEGKRMGFQALGTPENMIIGLVMEDDPDYEPKGLALN